MGGRLSVRWATHFVKYFLQRITLHAIILTLSVPVDLSPWNLGAIFM